MNGEGVKYDLGLAINSGKFVWANDPYRAGKWPDLSPFKEKLIAFLEKDESGLADNSYPHIRIFTLTTIQTDF